jgi:hypothetical protein
MQLAGLEAIIIFRNVSREKGFKKLSVSIDPSSWQCCAALGKYADSKRST